MGDNPIKTDIRGGMRLDIIVQAYWMLVFDLRIRACLRIVLAPICLLGWMRYVRKPYELSGALRFRAPWSATVGGLTPMSLCFCIQSWRLERTTVWLRECARSVKTWPQASRTEVSNQRELARPARFIVCVATCRLRNILLAERDFCLLYYSCVYTRSNNVRVTLSKLAATCG